jgi:hypothetical protein
MNSNLNSEILQAIANVKNETVGSAVGHDATFISKFTAGNSGLKITELEAFFTAIGMKVIKCEGEVISLPKSEHEALKLLAMKGLRI